MQQIRKDSWVIFRIIYGLFLLFKYKDLLVIHVKQMGAVHNSVNKQNKFPNYKSTTYGLVLIFIISS